MNFFVPKGRPSVRLTFQEKVFHRPADGSSKQQISSHTVVEINWLVGILFHVLQKVSRLPVTSILSIVAVKVANSVGRLKITVPPQILLNRLFRSTMSFFTHDGFICQDWKLSLCGQQVKQKVTSSLRCCFVCFVCFVCE